MKRAVVSHVPIWLYSLTRSGDALRIQYKVLHVEDIYFYSRNTMSSQGSQLSCISEADVSTLVLSHPTTRNTTTPKYRSAKPLTYELCEHCKIYFEESLCMKVDWNAPGAC